MSNLKLGSLLGVVASIALIAGVILGSLANGGLVAGGGVENDNPIFSRGLRAGQPAVQVVDSAGNFVGPISSANDVTLTGAFTPDTIGSGALNLSATTTAQTLTAAQVCSNSVINWPTTTSTGAITLPTAVALQADCLATNGGVREVIFRNTDSVSTSSFSFTAGASSTIITNYATSSQSAGDVLAGQAVSLKILKATTTTSNATMVEILATFFR